MAASDQIPGQEFEYVALRRIFFFSRDNRIGVGMVGLSAGPDGLLAMMKGRASATTRAGRSFRFLLALLSLPVIRLCDLS